MGIEGLPEDLTGLVYRSRTNGDAFKVTVLDKETLLYDQKYYSLLQKKWAYNAKRETRNEIINDIDEILN